MLIGARLGSPLVLGYGEGEVYLGSDALALAPLTQRIAYLEEGDWTVITRDGAQVYDADNQPVTREITTSGASAAAAHERVADETGGADERHRAGDGSEPTADALGHRERRDRGDLRARRLEGAA